MTDSKRNRIIAAVTVNVILLIFILAAVVVYQLVDITSKARIKKELASEIEYYTQLTETEQDTLEYYKSEEYLGYLALQYGFVYGD